jgi:16S rRNA (adenine1518-N6/adenine1519-N6)-dimethyltransferase
LIANLPYSVASPILVEFAGGPQPPSRMVVTVQLEVARRLAAEADTDDYGVLSLLVQVAFQPAGHFRIPADCFFPAPNVESACITLLRRPEPLVPAQQRRTFEKLVKRGFSQRRKMMLKLLKADWPEPVLQRAFTQVGLSPQIRAEKVTLDQFVQLTQCLQLLTEANA